MTQNGEYGRKDLHEWADDFTGINVSELHFQHLKGARYDKLRRLEKKAAQSKGRFKAFWNVYQDGCLDCIHESATIKDESGDSFFDPENFSDKLVVRYADDLNDVVDSCCENTSLMFKAMDRLSVYDSLIDIGVSDARKKMSEIYETWNDSNKKLSLFDRVSYYAARSAILEDELITEVDRVLKNK